jgi:hypothetical protein
MRCAAHQYAGDGCVCRAATFNQDGASCINSVTVLCRDCEDFNRLRRWRGRALLTGRPGRARGGHFDRWTSWCWARAREAESKRRTSDQRRRTEVCGFGL